MTEENKLQTQAEKGPSLPAVAASNLTAGVAIVVSPLTNVFQQLGQHLLSATKTAKAVSRSDRTALVEEVARQKLEMEIIERQARAAQEAAIAERIRYSHSVEMDEYYDVKAGGFLGSDKGSKIGVGVEARKVTRRTYKFEGNRVTEAEAIAAAAAPSAPAKGRRHWFGLID